MNKKVQIIEPVRSDKGANTAKRVCAYCRVSTEKADQLGSFEAQKHYYNGVIAKKIAWTLVEIYADYGKSGTSEESRIGFIRMLEDCELGKIDIIITKSISRFARNTVDCINTIRRLKELNIDVYFEEQNIHTLSENSELLLSILSAVAQTESENISTNEKWSIQKSFLNGTFKSRNPAYGYQSDKNGELKIQVEESKVVRFIFDEYLNGKGAWAIAKELSEKRIQTKNGHREWMAHTVRDILKNGIYTGDMLYQKFYTTETLPFVQKRNYGNYPQVLVENNHEAVISKEEYKSVQELFEYRDSVSKGDRSQRYEFSSKIICGECGGTFRRQTQAKRNREQKITQWGCKNHIQSKDICSIKSIPENVIKNIFVLMWNKLSSNCEEILKPLLESLNKVRYSNLLQKELEGLEKSILELSEQSRVLNQLMSKGYIDFAFYIEQQTAINLKISDTKKKKQMTMISGQAQGEIKETENLIKLIGVKPLILEEYNSRIFEQTVEKIIITPQKEIVFKLKNGLELSGKY